MNAALDLRVLLTNTELGQRSHSSRTHDRVLKNNTVVDVADVLRWLGSPGAFHTQEVKNTDGELGKFAIFNELTEVSKSLFLGFGDRKSVV